MGSGYLQRKLAAAKYAIVWEPQPGPQTSLLACPKFEVFFGGARGGGKTDGMLGEWASHQDRFGEHSNGIMFRRERTQLVDTIERSRQIFSPIGASYHEQDKLWRFPNGSRLQFAYLDRDADADGYQGRSHTRVYIEEIGTFPSSSPIFKLMATLRSGHGIPCGFRATGNPGGPGHQWVKARYIDPAPLGWREIIDDYVNPWTKDVVRRERIFIPSKLGDNKYLGADYVANLQMVGNPQLVRAWLEGDWSVIEGAFFPEFSEARHVIRPFEIPAPWLRFRSADWGSARPFSIGWWAVVADDFVVGHADGRRVLPRGAMVRYREWYGSSGPNVGLKLTAEEVADGIVSRETKEPQDVEGRSAIAYGVLDPAAFASDGGPCIAERMARRGVFFRRADNARVARVGALGGWDQLRSRLVGHDDRPMIYFFSTGRDSIRTLPALQHDRNKLEDVDTESEDHAPDECFIKDTMIMTKRGVVPISDIGMNDWVLSHRGWNAVEAVFSIGIRPTFTATFSDGTKLTGTANHPVYVNENGFIPLSQLRYGDMMRSCPILTNIDVLPERFGRSIVDRFQPVLSSITKMKIRPIMISRILNVCLHSPIAGIMRRWLSNTILFARTVTVNTSPVRIGDLAFVQMRASQLFGAKSVQTILNGNALTVGRFSRLIGSKIRDFVRYCAPGREFINDRLQNMNAESVEVSLLPKIGAPFGVPRHVVSVTPDELQKVYNLTVAGAKTYYANGVLVHNCRYACMSRPYIKDVPNKEAGRILSIGSLNQVRLDDLWEKADNQRRTRI